MIWRIGASLTDASHLGRLLPIALDFNVLRFGVGRSTP
jgi:hypothetical protein